MFLLGRGDRIPGEEVSLQLERLVYENKFIGRSPAYAFGIIQNSSEQRVGALSFRLGTSEYLMRYAGHIGYGIHASHRGNGYAFKATLLLRELALMHGFSSVRLTCNPDNIPSLKTLEKLGSLVEVVSVPRHFELYRQGDRMKMVFEWVLEDT